MEISITTHYFALNLYWKVYKEHVTQWKDIGVQQAWMKTRPQLGMEVRACNPSTNKAEAGGPGVRGQSGLHSKALSQMEKGKLKSLYHTVWARLSASVPHL
jgi:hypothetical protein